MSKKLTLEQVQHFREQGYLCPVDALSADKARQYRQRLEASEQAFGPIRKDAREARSHLLFNWAKELVREPAVVDAMEDLIGPNILMYTMLVWPKDAGSADFLSWHQDATYHSLDTDSVSAWIALTDASIEAGCMEVVPGSHRLGQLPHEEAPGGSNMLSRGQTIAALDAAQKTSFMPLRAGQMSLHHSYLFHRSGANNSADRRIGVTVNCIPTSAQCMSNVKVTATLLRGVDNFGHFELEPTPKADCDEQAKAAHAHAIRKYAEMKANTFESPRSRRTEKIEEK